MKCAKHGYRDRVAALYALAVIQKKDNPARRKTEQRAYPCPNCKRWHLTSRK